MKQKKTSKLNDGHYLEILDRLHCQITDIENHLLEHPVSEKYGELREHIIRALVNLVQGYQIAGSLTKAHRLKKKKP
jgi:hypothetical protein